MKYLMRSFLIVAALGFISKASAANYYVDPVNGNISNEGSSLRPWSTLEAIFTTATKKIFVGGDTIYLRRGNHGGPIITGPFTGASLTNPVTIIAESGHAPVMKWLVLNGAKYCVIQDIFINHELGATDSQGLITLQNASDYNIIRNVGAYSIQAPHGWAANETGWGGARNGIEIKGGGGANNTFERIHCMNLRNGIVSQDVDNIYQYNVVENFVEDGIRPNGNGQKFYYNVVMNAVMDDHSKPYAQRAHRDMWQETVGTLSNVEMIGNTMIAVSPELFPYICDYDETSSTKYMEVYEPVFAGWDGPFDSCIFANNVIFTEHNTGIWLNAATNCRVVNNTMIKTPILDLVKNVWTDRHPSFHPHIKIGSKTAGSTPSSGNYVYNNIGGAPILSNGGNTGGGTTSVAGSGNNLTITWATAPNFFLSPRTIGVPALDAHLRSTALTAINTANTTYAPARDADGIVRSAPDIGAYEYGTYVGADSTIPSTPGRPFVVPVSRLGMDLSWTASTDNRQVKGYDIYRNGVRIGRTRNGARFFDLTSPVTTDAYKIKAFDASGNESLFSTEGSSGGVQEDVTPPVISTMSNKVAEATSSAGVAVTYAAARVTDNVTVSPTVTYSQNSGAVFPIGTTTVTVNATDAAGNSATAVTFTVTVQDTTAPVITSTPSNKTVVKTSGAGATVTYSAATASDAVTTSPTITYSQNSGAVFPIGTTTVTVTATDAALNAVTSTFSITVLDTDTTPPVITAPANQTVVQAGSTGFATVTYAAATATDNVTASPTITYSQASGTAFPVGVTTVTITAVDAVPNTATSTFTITVLPSDTVSPVITVPANQTAEATSTAGAIVTYPAATATDNVTVGTTITYSKASGTLFPIGTTTVTATATDVAGNFDQDTFTVTVNDTSPPAAFTLSIGTVTTTSIAVSWISPADNGATGRAVSYDVRYSSSLITSSNFSSATAITSGVPTPSVAGSTENLTISNLTSSTSYYIAVMATDDVGNTRLSNSPVTMTGSTGVQDNSVSSSASCGLGGLTAVLMLGMFLMLRMRSMNKRH